MKVVAILGGLGSQMVKYSIYHVMQKTTNDSCFIDTSFFKYNNCWNGYELTRIFGINIDEREEYISDNAILNVNGKDKIGFLKLCLSKLCADEDVIYYYMGSSYFFRKGTSFQNKLIIFYLNIIRKLHMLLYVLKPREKFDKSIFSIKQNLYIDECFINSGNLFAEYKNELLKVFTFKVPLDVRNALVAKKMESGNSVSLHVRRTDHLSDNGNLFKRDYYGKSMSFIREKNPDVSLDVYVFSDDVQWCKDNPLQIGITDKEHVTYVDWNTGKDSYKDMQLMTYCKHNVIAISSFSWWGYYLSKRKDKIVCAPEGYWTEVENHF